ncbi:ATP-dependent DNA ligase [Sphingomonas sp. HDW15A]|uniref:ATP-dependent DNA ligase n=1 Tax=Sphingomonas sp. HDW15A TaxID=2714942 RepID=UPI00140C1F79|nr:ATP-dependent DNA ligase [Sphingomonas sp. HDW15A]QIK97061.1 ATP-dependent DNA ligase [Sphingomonas sp. HDW15A]
MHAIAPMEALLAQELPTEPGWQFEPKWDGFRCIAVRDGGEVALWSKSGKPLGRYFPDVVEMIGRMKAKRFVIDGELLIASGDTVSFDALQLRLHPAASRVAKLAEATPASFMAFDCLASESTILATETLAVRRAALEKLLAAEKNPGIFLSPATTVPKKALGWLERSGGALDGVIAKRLDEPYRSGERAMIKVKPMRTADCIVGGFRYVSGSRSVGSLLLGLYDEAGLLHHVGFTSSLAKSDRKEWTTRLEPLIEPPGFTGDAPGGPSRWSTERSAEWQPLKPEIVIEVAYDQVTSGRFRHGTKIVRERPDKAPRQCRCDQLAPALTPARLRQLTA